MSPRIPDNYLVEFTVNGENRKFITLEKSRAFEYAGVWHGRVFPCFAERKEGDALIQSTSTPDPSRVAVAIEEKKGG